MARLGSASSNHIPQLYDSTGHRPVHEEKASSSYEIENQARLKSLPPIYVSQMQGPEESEVSKTTSPVRSYAAFGANSSPASILRTQEDGFGLRRAVSSFRPGAYQDEHQKSTPMRNNPLPVQSSQAPSLPRPQSVPVPHHGLYDDGFIPPKRELPFLKERENSKIRRASANKLPELPISAAAAPTAIPISMAISTSGAPQKVAKRVAERNTRKKSPIQEEAVLPNASHDVSNLPAMRREESQPAGKITSASVSFSAGTSLPSAAVSKKRPSSVVEEPLREAKRPRMVDQSTQTQTLSGRDHTAPLRALSDSAANTTPVPPPPSRLDQIDDFVRANQSRPAPVDIFETPGYATASDEERQSMLNDWICDNLENEDFLQLCKDMEHSWRRIGLGF